MGTEPRCQQHRGSGGRGAQAQSGGRILPSLGRDPSCACRGMGEGTKGAVPASQSINRSSVNGPYGGDTRSSDVCGQRVREAAIFTEGQARAEPVGAQGVWGQRASGARGAGSLAHWGRPPRQGVWGAQCVWGWGPSSLAYWETHPIHLPPLLQRVGRLRGSRKGRVYRTPAGWEAEPSLGASNTLTHAHRHTQHSQQPKDTRVTLATLCSRPCTRGHRPRARAQVGA